MKGMYLPERPLKEETEVTREKEILIIAKEILMASISAGKEKTWNDCLHLASEIVGKDKREIQSTEDKCRQLKVEQMATFHANKNPW